MAGWRWGLLVALAYVVATVIMTWPYAARVGSATPLGEDPLLQIWVARWVQHALLTDPLHLYDANIYYPFKHTLAYSDSNIPAALLAWPIYLISGNPVLANNLLVLGTFVLAAGGMCALVGRLAGNRAAGFLAGLAYAFLPYRFAHIYHLNQLGHAWTPWVLLALLLLIERQTWRRALAFGLLLAVQILTSFYVAFQLALAVGLALLAAFAADPRTRSGRFLGRLAAACGLAALLIIPPALPYIQVRNEQGLQRTVWEAERFQARPQSYLTATPDNRLWGRLYKSLNGEDMLFPGALALLGAGVGLAGSGRRRALTSALLLLATGAFVISLGPTWQPERGGTTPLPYRFLYDHFPFFKAMRVPARFGVLVDFAIVVLAGFGVAWAWERLRPRLPNGLGGFGTAGWGTALTAVLAVLLLVDLFAAPVVLVPLDRGVAEAAPYQWLADQPDQAPVMEFPAYMVGRDVGLAMFWSTVHWKPLVEGYSGFAPQTYGEAVLQFTGDLTRPNGTVANQVSYVNARNIGVLQDLGVRYLVLHRSGYKREDWPSVIAQLEGTGAVDLAAEFDRAVIYRVREPAGPPLQPSLDLFAPALVVSPNFWEPTLVVRNPRDGLARLAVTRPLRLAATWRDERGREVRHDSVVVNLPAILPPGELFCSVRVCPAASGFSVPPEEPGGRRSSVRLYPEAPGRYTVELALTGEIELRRTLEVEVVDSPPPAAEDGPPIAFAGASLATDDVRAGETAQLTLDWETRSQPPEDYTIFAQFIGADGKVWGQYDAPAGWTSHYSSAWLPGERVSLSWPVPLKPDAPPGQYRLLLGMYRRTATGIERVPVRWPAGDATEYWVGEVTVR